MNVFAEEKGKSVEAMLRESIEAMPAKSMTSAFEEMAFYDPKTEFVLILMYSNILGFKVVKPKKGPLGPYEAAKSQGGLQSLLVATLSQPGKTTLDPLHIDCFIPVGCALLSFVCVLLGIRRHRGFQEHSA
eukprot:gnl/TRDRNA2_/TRDRNA2_136954_c0_seq5.p1 gnl/TRDRNA2_/TRDRNA2_136954_c0~~gnl/TRDRNA2_/TRDRNA2_136954_c0_seq5.p1  ORF type:complete len:131 (-),score=24.87 gnl/TRDRNA2_/TRDRNA2_136954_c0_seq5:55-447(-)